MTQIEVRPVHKATGTWYAEVSLLEDGEHRYTFDTEIDRLTQEDARLDGEEIRWDLLRLSELTGTGQRFIDNI